MNFLAPLDLDFMKYILVTLQKHKHSINTWVPYRAQIHPVACLHT